MTYHVCSTFLLGGLIDKQVLWPSSKITALGHYSLLHGLHPIDDYGWSGTNVQTVDIAIRLPQLGENMITCQCLKYTVYIYHITSDGYYSLKRQFTKIV